jgi:hypothetical protein
MDAVVANEGVVPVITSRKKHEVKNAAESYEVRAHWALGAQLHLHQPAARRIAMSLA